jgi:hypothetical protein
MLVFVFTMLLAAHKVYIKGQVGGEDADNNDVTPPSKATTVTAKSFQPTAQQVTSAADYHAPAYHADPPGVMSTRTRSLPTIVKRKKTSRTGFDDRHHRANTDRPTR